MSPNEARKHLMGLHKRLSDKEAQLLKDCGPIIPRTTRAYQAKTIKALEALLKLPQPPKSMPAQSGASSATCEIEADFMKGVGL